MFDDVVALTADLPERRLADGEVLLVEGDEAHTVAVLVEGELVVEVGGTAIDRHIRPGTFIGETGALLGQPRNATVSAVGPTVVRQIGEPDEFFAEHPALALELARQLAGRLHRLRAYVTEVQAQFGHHDDHLGLFGELLHRIAITAPIDLDPGSDRAPDY